MRKQDHSVFVVMTGEDCDLTELRFLDTVRMESLMLHVFVEKD